MIVATRSGSTFSIVYRSFASARGVSLNPASARASCAAASANHEVRSRFETSFEAIPASELGPDVGVPQPGSLDRCGARPSGKTPGPERVASFSNRAHDADAGDDDSRLGQRVPFRARSSSGEIHDGSVDRE